jgi:hypothetical protein
MGVARQIGEHGLWPGERLLGVDDPFGAAQRGEEGVEGCPVSKASMLPVEGQTAVAMEPGQPLEEPAPEQPGEHAHGEEEGRPAGDPLRSVRRQAAAWHDHVGVRVVGHGRAPCVQHRGDADPCAEVLGVGGDGERGLGARPHEEIIDEAFVLIGDVGDWRRQSEDEVEVANRQQFGLARCQPGLRGPGLALRAVPVAAGIIGDVFMGAVLAARHMAAECRGAALLDGLHHLQLREADVPGVGGPPRRPVVAEDVRDLQR